MYLNIQKFQNAAGPISTESWRRYIKSGLDEGWERDYTKWDNSWTGENDIRNGQEYKDWTADLLNDVERAEGSLTFIPTHQQMLKDADYDKGYEGWNQAFAKLNLNAKYFGNNATLYNYLGPTTYTRHKYYDGLKTKYNSASAALKTNNGSIYWDNNSKKWVSVSNPTVTTGQPAGQTGTATGGQPAQQTVTTGQTGATEDPASQQPGQPGNTDEDPTEKPLWTDWIPHTSQLATDLVASANKFNLATQRDVPLQSGYYEQYRTGENYFQQQALKQQAAEMRARGNQNLTSDMNYNMRQRQAYEDKAQQLELQAQEIKSKAYNQSMQEAQAVANRNIQRDVTTANTNREKLAAYRNYINDAKQALNVEKAAAWKSYVGNMYTDSTQWNSTQQINDAYKREKQNALNYATQIQDKYTDLQTAWSDPETSDVYKEFAAYVADPSTGQAFGNQRPVNPKSQEYTTWLRQQWDSDLGKTWRERYEKAKEDAYMSAGQWVKALQLKMQAGDVDTLYYYPGSTTWVSTNTKPKEKPRIITNAKGGRVTRLIDYANAAQKQMQFSQKQQMEANKQNVSHLNKELDRLNREQIALLRAMFK